MEYILLYGILAVITVWDLKTFRIPNGFILAGIPIGLATSLYVTGWSGLWISLWQMICVFTIMFLIWAFFELIKMPAIGGGDMKLFVLMASFSPILSTKDVFIIAFLSVLMGAALFVVLLLLTRPSSIKRMFDQLAHLFLYFIPNKSEENMKKLAFSVPIVIATVLHLQGGIGFFS